MEWVPEYAPALARAKKEKKLVLIDFYTDWCGWCKRLDSDVFSQESFQKAASGVLACKVNAEVHPDLAARYQVNSFPRLFFINSEGVTVERIRGYLSLQDFTTKVQAVKHGDTEYAHLRDAASDPSNLGAIYAFAQMLTDDSQFEAAIPYWQQVHDLALQQAFANQGNQASLQFHRQALVQLGRGYATVGLNDVAKQHFEEALSAYPGTPEAAQASFELGTLELKLGHKARGTELLSGVARDYAGTSLAMQAVQALQQPPAVMASGAPK